MFPALEKVVKNFKPKYDDDSTDRLNYALTTKFLSLLIVIIGMKQYIGEPLQCWMSAEFKGNWEKYIESYCKFWDKIVWQNCRVCFFFLGLRKPVLEKIGSFRRPNFLIFCLFNSIRGQKLNDEIFDVYF